MKAWMTHNPKCQTSRNVLALLREKGIEPDIREYLKEPLTRAELAALIAEMGVVAKELVRWKEKEAVEQAGISEDSSEAALIRAMADDLLPVMPPFIGRVCSGYAPQRGVLQTPSV